MENHWKVFIMREINKTYKCLHELGKSQLGWVKKADWTNIYGYLFSSDLLEIMIDERRLKS